MMLKHLCSFKRFNSINTHESHNFLICIGIDGIECGDSANDHFFRAMKLIKHSNCPFMVLSNDAHFSEPTFASILSKKCDVGLSYRNVVVLQSPLRSHKDIFTQPVLAVGPRSSLDVLRSLGFVNIFLLKELEAAFQHLADRSGPIPESLQSISSQFKALVLLNSPNNWKASIGMLIAFLASGGCLHNYVRTNLENVFAENLPHPDIFVANRCSLVDRNFPNFSVSQGVFAHMLETTYESVFKRPLVYKHHFGKPYLSTYKFLMERILKTYKKIPEKIYIIGRDSATDIVGSNVLKNHLLAENIKCKVFSYHCDSIQNIKNPFFLRSNLIQNQSFSVGNGLEFSASSTSDFTVPSPCDAIREIFDHEAIYMNVGER